MRISKLFTKTLREAPKDEISTNAKLLTRGGFIFKNSAGVYSFLPLGWRVIRKIENIIREEMLAISGQEIFMPALVEKRYWDTSGRWDVEIGFEVKGKKEREPSFVLGWTHEEVLAEITKKYINSYKDLPFYAYQFQTKFRNEPRAKSGLLRGREFLMKDLYSFHASEEDFWDYYGKAKTAYNKIFDRCGLKTIYTLAGGGTFTASNTHEFQVVADVGEDTIFICEKCEYAENKEISELKEGSKCPKCGGKIHQKNAIEVGNIFPLGTKFSEAFNLKYVDKDGKSNLVVMGSYGIGIGRLMGAMVEIHHDEKGIIWPESVAPFKIHLVALDGKAKEADRVYKELVDSGADVLYDDRDDKTAGEKFTDADLIGCPVRLVISEETLKNNSAEMKRRDKDEVELVSLNKLQDVG